MEQKQIKCRFCDWLTPEGDDLKTKSPTTGFTRLRKHIASTHPEEHKKVRAWLAGTARLGDD